MEVKKEQVAEKGLTEYQVAGQTVKLSFNIVKNFLVKGNGEVNNQDIIQFISICKYNQLNPFLNEAYLVKYGSEPATMIVSKEAFFKRADACDNYEGIEAGVIVQRGETFIEVEGTFKQPDDVLLGGWAKVYRSDRRVPFVAKVNINEYIQVKKDGTPNRFWKEKPATMICKVAKMQALREAFPAQLGAMYTQEEVIHTEDTKTEIKANANKESFNIESIDFEEVKTSEKDKKKTTTQQESQPESKQLQQELNLSETAPY